MRRFLTIGFFLVSASMPRAAWAGPVPTSAQIVSLTPSCSGISVTGNGSYQLGISRVTFSLADLTKDPFHSFVDSKEIDYSNPEPRQATATWNSTAVLTPGVSYGVGFQVWNKGYIVAYTVQKFTCA